MNKARKLILSSALVVGILATSVTAFAGTCSTTYSGSFCGPSTTCPTSFSFSGASANSGSNAGFIPINVISSQGLKQIATANEKENVAPTSSQVKSSVSEKPSVKEQPSIKEKSSSCLSSSCDDQENCLNDCETNCVGDDCQNTNNTCSTGSTSCAGLGINCDDPENCLNDCETNCEGDDCQAVDNNCSTGSFSTGNKQNDTCFIGGISNRGNASNSSFSNVDLSSLGNIDFSSIFNQGGSSSCGR